MPRPTESACGRCRFVEPGDAGEGECHANPPGPDGWPLVSLRTGWCGDFMSTEHWLEVERRALARIARHDAQDEADDKASDNGIRPIKAQPKRAAGGRS